MFGRSFWQECPEPNVAAVAEVAAEAQGALPFVFWAGVSAGARCCGGGCVCVVLPFSWAGRRSAEWLIKLRKR